MVSISSFMSPVGIIRLAASDKGLCFLSFETDKEIFNKQLVLILKTNQIAEKKNLHIEKAESELSDYFGGRLKKFEVALDLKGTDFQLKVWKKLTEIPYGELRTYQDIAELVGGKHYSRAVGTANKNNPVPVIVPCHRVIRKGRKISNYSGGLHIQRALFDLEKIKYDDIKYINN